MTKIKNTKKGMAKKTLSMSLVVAMLATSNVPVWAAEFSDGTDTTNITSEANAFTDAEADTPVVNDASSDAVSAQATDNEVTLTTDSTVKSLSTLKKDGLTVTTNYKDGATRDFGCVSFVLKNGAINIGDANPSVNASNQELGYYVTATGKSNNKITTTDKKSYTLKLDNWDEYVGKTITAILYQDTTSVSGYDNGNVYKTVDFTIAKDSNQEYVKTQFVAKKEYGTKLTDALAKDMISDTDKNTTKLVLDGGLDSSAISNVKWYDNSDVLQASNYETKQGDVAKTYTAKATLTTPLGASEVTLGTVTIKEKATVPGKVKSATWDSGTVDASGNVTFTYDGTAHYPKLTQVTLNDGTKINATDEGVTITYTALTEAQATDANEDTLTPASSGVNYTATITTPKYNISYDVKLIINKIDLEKAGTLNVGKGFEFNPSGIYTVSKDLLDNAGLTVTASGKTLEYAASGKDYSVTLSASDSKVGTDKMTVKVEGTGNYKGTIVAKAPINAYELKDEDVTLSPTEYVFDGNEKKPTATVKYKKDGQALRENTDYTVSYINNTNVGTATVKVEGKGNYTGTVEKTFEIKNGDFKDLVNAIKADFTSDKCVYTGKPIDLVKDNYLQYKYRKGTDFTISYEPQNVNVGKVNIKITGQGNYKGNTGNVEFDITARSIADKDVKVNVQGLTYSTDMTDKQITDATTLTYNGMTLVENTDYEVKVVSRSGKNIVLSIKGLGNYNNARTETVSVTAKDINTVTLPKIDAQKYSGYDFVVNASGTEVQTNNKKVADFEIKDGNHTLKLGEDYKISSYENNKSVGTAKINIVGIGAYSGKATISFPIVAKELNGTIMYKTAVGVTALLPDQEYNYKDATSSKGYTFDFTSVATDKKLVVIDENGQPVSTDNYTVTYTDNKAAGTATITVEGKGGYKLNAVNTFKIVPAKLSKVVSKFNVKTGTYNYTGEAIEPELTVEAKDDTYKLVKDVDYKVEYSDNVNVGTAKVKLVGLGNYAGAVTETSDIAKVSDTFTIERTGIRATDISVADTPYAGGITVTPNITIKNQYSGKDLVEGTDYTVEVTKGGVNVGQAKAKIKLTTAATKNYTLVGGTEYSVDFNVTALDLSKATISAIADQVATGEQVKPAVTVMNGAVKLTEGKDYEVTYGDNKEVGEGTVTIKALSSNKNYTGSQTVKFNIVKETPAVGQAMISEVRVSGNTVTPVLSGDVDGAVGYDYVIATEEDYENGRVDISKNVLKTNTNFYYVQEGTYYAYCHAWKRDENGKKVFGAWSNLKKFEVTATTPSTPKITKVKVSGSTVTVTYTKSKDATGYDVVLGSSVKSVNGEKRPVDYGTLVKKNVNGSTVTVTFKNVKKGTYYAGLHSFNRTSENGSKVFSKWSNTKTVTVK